MERFRLASDFVHFIEALVRHRIHCRDRRGLFVVPTADIDAFVCRVVAQVIRASLKIQSVDELERIAVIDVKLALLAGYKQFVGLRRKGNALGSGDPGDLMDASSREKLDHFDRIVAKPRNEHLSFAGSKMIETALHALQRYGSCPDDRRRSRGCRRRILGSARLFALTRRE